MRQRFVLELSAPALTAAVNRARKDYVKPETWDKMKKRERNAYWNEWEDKTISDFVAANEAGTLIDDASKLLQFGSYLKAGSAHAAWRVEAGRRHPDQGGSPEAAAAFNTVWDRVEKIFPKAPAAVKR